MESSDEEVIEINSKKKVPKNVISEDDIEKYKYLSKYFKLEKIYLHEGKSKNLRNLYFKCQMCPAHKNPMSCQESSMSNLPRHYKHAHSALVTEFEKVYYSKPWQREKSQDDVKKPMKQQRLVFNSHCTQAQLNEKVVDFIIDTVSPFNTGENESFRNMIKLLDPTKTAPVYKTVVKGLNERYELMMENLSNELAKVDHTTLATDAWSGNHKNYVGFSVSWLSDELERNHAVLGIRRLKGSHTFDVVRREIISISKEFK